MATITELKCGLTAERLREILDYNQETGVFRWRISPAIRVTVGDIAGGWDGEYWAIWIESKKHLAQRLAWLYVHGMWPDGDVDHKDTVKHHNSIKNLRQATRSQNIANSLRHTENTSGYKGVTRHGRRWQARIRQNYKLIHLGTYDTPEEAHAAYCTAARELFGEFANDGS